MSKLQYMELEAILELKGTDGTCHVICRYPSDEKPIEDLTSEEAYERCTLYLAGIQELADEEGIDVGQDYPARDSYIPGDDTFLKN